VKVTLRLEPKDFDRYQRVLDAVAEVNTISGSKARVTVDDHTRPLIVLPRPQPGSDPVLGARHLANDLPERAIGLVIDRSIPYKERDALEAAGLSWFDGRGAIHLSWPGTFVHIDHSSRRLTSSGSANYDGPRLGPTGIRAVQVILGSDEWEWTVSQLAEHAAISVGQAHNVFRAMEQNRLVHAIGRGPKQRRILDDRRAALDWLSEIDGARRRPVAAATYLYSRTERDLVQRFAERATDATMTYAVTGAAACNLLGAPVLSRITVTQVRVSGIEPAEALSQLGLEHLDADDAGRGMNVEVWSDVGQVGTYGAKEIQGVRIAPAIRVWLDLQRQGGRSRDAAQLFKEQFIDRA
jgi:hypothetical protein